MDDLTVIYLTLNLMPDGWVNYQLDHLIQSAGSFPIISISKIPMNLGNNLLDTEETGYANIYRQMLRAAKIAETEFVAVAEDDVLYTPSHFRAFRPQADEFAYNRHRWSLFTWGEPVYSLRNRLSNCSMVAPRLLLIESLQEVFDKHNGCPPDNRVGECGREKIARRLGVTVHKQVDFESQEGIIHLNHIHGTEDKQQRQWKSHARIRAYDIPCWGKASDVLKNYAFTARCASAM
jgi:hypothetical protein